MSARFELIRWMATDGVELTGFLAGGRRQRVAIYLHGLGGNAYRSPMIPALAVACARRRLGLFAINTRGHDVVTSRVQRTRRTPTNGAVYEVFPECLHDLRGALRWLRGRGVRVVYLMGHSTGANKIAYALQCGLHVRGIRIGAAVYLAPGDDIGIQQQVLGRRQYRAMQRVAARWHTRLPHRLMPVKNLGYLDISAASYHSLYGERNRMDQFPFRALRPSAAWRRLTTRRLPGLMILGANDEYLPVSAPAIRDFFLRAYPRFPVCLIPRANHSFRDREVTMARRVVQFLCAGCAPW